MEIEELLLEQDQLRMITHCKYQTINQLREWNLIRKPQEVLCINQNCNQLDQVMPWIIDDIKRDDGKYRCSACRKTSSLTSNSIFFRSRISLNCLFRIIFIGFIEDIPAIHLHKQINIHKVTIGNIYQYCRNQISEHIQQEEEENLLEFYNVNEVDENTGQQHSSPAIETDQSLFTHLVGVDNVYDAQVWVYGMYDRGSGNFFLRSVENRNSETTLRIFQECVTTRRNRRTRIYSDGASWFPILQQNGYEHTAVIHENGNFDRGIRTTSHIEGLWSSLKAFRKFDKGQSYNNIQQVQVVLNELKWRYQQRNNNNLASNLASILSNSHELIIRNL